MFSCAFKVVNVHFFVRSNFPMFRLSCFESHLCPDFGALKVSYMQLNVCFFMFPDRAILKT